MIDQLLKVLFPQMIDHRFRMHMHGKADFVRINITNTGDIALIQQHSLQRGLFLMQRVVHPLCRNTFIKGIISDIFKAWIGRNIRTLLIQIHLAEFPCIVIAQLPSVT